MTECTTLVSRHLEYLREGFWCEQEGEYTCITTPYLYPDFDCIQVYVKESEDGKLSVSDLGEALRHIVIMCGHDLFESQEEAIRSIASKHNLMLADDGELMCLTAYGEVGWAIFRVSMAMKEIADLVHTAKAKREIHFIDQVRDVISKRQLKFTPRFPIQGKTSSHRVDFFVESNGGQLIQVIGQQGRKAKIWETYGIYNDLTEAGIAIPRLVIVQKTLPRQYMDLLRSKSNQIIPFQKQDELISALG